VTGDKVVIKLCRPLSQSKSYFVQRVVKPFPRDDYYIDRKEEEEEKGRVVLTPEDKKESL
jgi:hypothetical protein